MAESIIPPIGPRRGKRLWLRIVLGLLLCLGVVLASVVWWRQPGTRSVSTDLKLPVRYDEDRFYAEPVTSNGTKLVLLTDTGGGMFLTRAALLRAGGTPIQSFGRTRARLPAFRPEAAIPEPSGAERRMPIWDDMEGDGMLGQRWFAGGVWTFDYPGRLLVLRATPFAPNAAMAQHAVPLGFPTTLGIREGHHPRFTVSIGGESVEALFDTGATAWLSPQAVEIMHDSGHAERATSFIQGSLYDRLHSAHPQWRTIANGCVKSHAEMIEVPEVEVAGLKAGPVWFTRRSDATYVWMSSFMDKPIAASVGGNFFRHFRITVDYPRAVAYFEASTP